ncbi:MAG: DoxX family membrane protein [Deltaproteobacteria bacterium]|nr:MAG: DoxX family membrane protein [Deltaproteobacteria bacterium]
MASPWIPRDPGRRGMTTEPIGSRMSAHPVGRWLANRYLLLVSRLLLGGLFLFAAIPKIEDPARFAEDIRAYEILPYWAVNGSAILLPAIELLLAGCLILGIWTRSAVVGINALLLLFIGAIASTIVRGLEIDCGCFGEAVEESTGWGVILRDLLFLALGLHILLFAPEEKAAPTSLRRLFLTIVPRRAHIGTNLEGPTTLSEKGER